MNKIFSLLMIALFLNSVAPGLRKNCFEQTVDAQKEQGIVYLHYLYTENDTEKEKVVKVATGYLVGYVIREDLILDSFNNTSLSNEYEISSYTRYNNDQVITLPYILTEGDQVEYYKGVTNSFHIYVNLSLKTK